jgi:hypothetical protein
MSTIPPLANKQTKIFQRKSNKQGDPKSSFFWKINPGFYIYSFMDFFRDLYRNPLPKMSHNFSSSLMTVSTPLLVMQASSLSSIQFPRDWCDKSRDLPSCMCQEQHDVLVMDISEDEEAGYSVNSTRLNAEDDLSRLVDWWTEGVVLPSICGIGILGRFHQKVLSVSLSCFRKYCLYICPHKQKD